MNHQVLARKWRPKNFQEVIGQEHVLRALSNALTQNRLHHAYLFSGTRGVGKTTIARILAKCLNCETGITATPCGACDTCLEIDSGRYIDLIEVDAASRTKVEDTRDLLDNVQYLPTRARYKIYLIDEVHMLSGHSFNALLKTLEEPPEHVKFLLATTDPQRLPITVLSRCLQFNLKNLSPEFISQQLQKILTQEQINFELPALQQISRTANGSVRDALSLLDQAIAFGNNSVLTADVNAMLGCIDTTKIFALLEALANNDAVTAFNIIEQLAELNSDFTNVLDELLQLLQYLAIIQLVPEVKTNDWPHPELLAALAKKITPENVQLYYQIALIGKRDLPLAPNSHSGFNMIVMRMLAFQPELQQTPLPPVAKTPVTPAAAPNTNDLLQKLNLIGPTLALTKHCVVAKISSNQVELLLEPNQAPFLNKKHEERIEQALNEYFKKPMQLKITLGTANMDTPANLQKQEQILQNNMAIKSITNDPKINSLMQKFDAKIVPGSVQHLETN